jgi:hypothetical protein
MKSLLLLPILLLSLQSPSLAADSVKNKACLITAQSDRLFALKDGGNRRSADRKWAASARRCIASIQSEPIEAIALRYVPPGRRGAPTKTLGGGTRANPENENSIA